MNVFKPLSVFAYNPELFTIILLVVLALTEMCQLHVEVLHARGLYQPGGGLTVVAQLSGEISVLWFDEYLEMFGFCNCTGL